MMDAWAGSSLAKFQLLHPVLCFHFLLPYQLQLSLLQQINSLCHPPSWLKELALWEYTKDTQQWSPQHRREFIHTC